MSSVPPRTAQWIIAACTCAAICLPDPGDAVAMERSLQMGASRSAAVGREVTSVSGVVVAGGVECPLLRLPSGEQVALEGVSRSDAPIGAALTVRGFPIEFSTCQQGKPFQVLEMSR